MRALLAAGLVASCQQESLGALPAQRPEQPPSEVVPIASTRAGDDWATLAALSALPALSERPHAAPGHLEGRHLAIIRVSRSAHALYLARAPAAEFPAGTTIAEVLLTPETLDEGPLFAMRKLVTGTWQFAARGSSGEAVPEASLALCIRCHAEAHRAPLFGPAVVLEAQK